jgi:hypothetical protein
LAGFYEEYRDRFDLRDRFPAEELGYRLFRNYQPELAGAVLHLDPTLVVWLVRYSCEFLFIFVTVNAVCSLFYTSRRLGQVAWVDHYSYVWKHSFFGSLLERSLGTATPVVLRSSGKLSRVLGQYYKAMFSAAPMILTTDCCSYREELTELLPYIESVVGTICQTVPGVADRLLGVSVITLLLVLAGGLSSNTRTPTLLAKSCEILDSLL